MTTAPSLVCRHRCRWAQQVQHQHQQQIHLSDQEVGEGQGSGRGALQWVHARWLLTAFHFTGIQIHLRGILQIYSQSLVELPSYAKSFDCYMTRYDSTPLNLHRLRVLPTLADALIRNNKYCLCVSRERFAGPGGGAVHPLRHRSHSLGHARRAQHRQQPPSPLRQGQW